MKKRELEHAEDALLVEEYRRAAIAQAEAMSHVKPRVANRHADVMYEIARILRLRGLSAQERLLPLLLDENDDVRMWAGAQALEFAPEKAVPVLERLEQSTTGSRRTTAHYTLKEWRRKKSHSS